MDREYLPGLSSALSCLPDCPSLSLLASKLEQAQREMQNFAFFMIGSSFSTRIHQLLVLIEIFWVASGCGRLLPGHQSWQSWLGPNAYKQINRPHLIVLVNTTIRKCLDEIIEQYCRRKETVVTDILEYLLLCTFTSSSSCSVTHDVLQILLCSI